MRIKVIDSLMGTGKTNAIINYINSSDDDVRFIFVTPYLTEVDRIMNCCPGKEFCQPQNFSTKLRGLKLLLQYGRNIVTTHSLFHYFDQEIIDSIYDKNYVLIMDEVVDVIMPYEIGTNKEIKDGITKSDVKCILSNFGHHDLKNHLLIWDDNTYEGCFDKYKRMCELGCLGLSGKNETPFWLFPTSVFAAFKEVFVMTYMFEAQLQKYYYDLKGIEYEYLYVGRDESGKYFISPDKSLAEKKDFKSLITICENEKLNRIGKRKADLSKGWYQKNKDDYSMRQLKNNTTNYFRNILKAKSNRCLWTTFREYKNLIRGKGYTKGFVSCNMRATNEYIDRDCVAYLMNRYMNPVIKNFFTQNGVCIDEDKYALSEMLQFIWRTAIRKDKPINVYVPSSRMRRLLKTWINENSTSV